MCDNLMDDLLISLLSSTQLLEQGPRREAELKLEQVQLESAFPRSLASIAAHRPLKTSIRQSALTNLHLFIEKNWAADRLEEPGVSISSDTRISVKQTLLDLAARPDEDRSIKILSWYVSLCHTSHTLTPLPLLPNRD
jgi:importin-9